MGIELISGKEMRKVLGTEMKTPISWAVRAGDFIFLAGIAPIDANWNTVGKTMKEQYERVMEIADAVLKDAGANVDDIVKMTHFVTIPVTMDKVYPDEIAAIKRKWFKSGYYPPSTLMEVTSGMMPNQLVEVDIIAYSPRKAK